MEETNQPTEHAQPQQTKHKNTGMAVVAYILFFIPLLTDAKNDPFVKFHVKQGFVLFIGWIIAAILWSVPFVMLIAPLLQLGLFVLFILGIINAVNGKEEKLPLIGQYADKLHV